MRIDHLGAKKFDVLHNSERKIGLVTFRVGFHNVVNVFYTATIHLPWYPYPHLWHPT